MQTYHWSVIQKCNVCSEPMWGIEARNAAIANAYYTVAINRVGTVSIFHIVHHRQYRHISLYIVYVVCYVHTDRTCNVYKICIQT